MTRWVALLRGINVGGNRRIPMAELRELAQTAGFDDVETYIQSGNLILSSEKPEKEITDILEARISNRFGFDVPVCLRDARSFRAIASSHPFESDEDDDRFLVVAFLDHLLRGSLRRPCHPPSSSPSATN